MGFFEGPLGVVLGPSRGGMAAIFDKRRGKEEQKTEEDEEDNEEEEEEGRRRRTGLAISKN